MGACPTDTDLFHEPGENGGNQTCYYNGFSRPSFTAPSLYSRWQQGDTCAGESGRAARFRAARRPSASGPDVSSERPPGRRS
ncbi:hypothetical protein DF047_31600 [Burkholderia cenocepacia]|uniref:Uncharacterized protein n=1 Tax=Burkholderia cenocepacia TaxID=95486 RepID=A0A1V2XS14_9BURK|nr:hypothetical protein A8E88_26745 [Burkholderia cenocepacia]AQQ37148.1 hypothetical protein A8E96_14145 [Burkholderia cenocepacia]AQQ51650.1 hypothetical protein A8F32_35830 [Burkholderia cenocepacia]AWG32217.1 hypothetical protein B9Z07_26145 [Burkholderia cenocepacia]ONJ05936.1 hypothetical protein A8F53_04650 [Burkholderia cenocepacia]